MTELRDAVPEDLPEVLRLCRARELPAWPVRRVSGEARREALAEAYRARWSFLGSDPDLHVLVAPREGGLAGYAVLLTGQRESITGEPQAILYDHAWEDRAVGERLVRAAEARARGADYLVAEADPADTFLESLGYHLEIVRIARRLDPRPPGESAYTVRPARPGDQLFILVLNGKVTPFTLPAGRDLDPREVASRYLDVYLGLDIARDPRLLVLIAETGGLPVGYLMLKLGYSDEITGERIGYIYDLAVEPEHWGRRATQRLMREAEARLHADGVALMLGDISADNPRAVKTAVKSLGYAIEGHRRARRLKPLS